MSLPAWRTRRGGPQPPLLSIGAAAVVAWFAPILFGLILGFGIFPLVDSIADLRSLNMAVGMVALVAILSFKYTWIGLVPGVIVWRALWWRGYGGWLATALAGMITGVAISVTGGFAFVALFLFGDRISGIEPGSSLLLATFGLIQSLVFWFALNRFAPRCFSNPHSTID